MILIQLFLSFFLKTKSYCFINFIDFSVRPKDGTIAVKRRTTFDFETKSNFTFFVCVNDSIHETNQTVHVEITPVNEFAPTVNKSESCLPNLKENKESTCQFQVKVVCQHNHYVLYIMYVSITGCQTGCFKARHYSSSII